MAVGDVFDLGMIQRQEPSVALGASLWGEGEDIRTPFLPEPASTNGAGLYRIVKVKRHVRTALRLFNQLKRFP